jgi:hypothetical protein
VTAKANDATNWVTIQRPVSTGELKVLAEDLEAVEDGSQDARLELLNELLADAALRPLVDGPDGLGDGDAGVTHSSSLCWRVALNEIPQTDGGS